MLGRGCTCAFVCPQDRGTMSSKKRGSVPRTVLPFWRRFIFGVGLATNTHCFLEQPQQLECHHPLVQLAGPHNANKRVHVRCPSTVGVRSFRWCQLILTQCHKKHSQGGRLSVHRPYPSPQLCHDLRPGWLQCPTLAGSRDILGNSRPSLLFLRACVPHARHIHESTKVTEDFFLLFPVWMFLREIEGSNASPRRQRFVSHFFPFRRSLVGGEVQWSRRISILLHCGPVMRA